MAHNLLPYISSRFVPRLTENHDTGLFFGVIFMIDFSKYKKGMTLTVHVCNECARKAKITTKEPADSGKQSWFCEVCQHHNIGSNMLCVIGSWLRVLPKEYSL